MTASPRTLALRYRIWAHCEPLGWDTSVREIAEALDEPTISIAKVVSHAGWQTRLRAPASAINGEIWYRRATNANPSRVIGDVVSGRIGVVMETFQ